MNEITEEQKEANRTAENCDLCDGTGTYEAYCKACKGTGMISVKGQGYRECPSHESRKVRCTH